MMISWPNMVGVRTSMAASRMISQPVFAAGSP